MPEMLTGPLARILLRYIAGAVFGWQVGEALAADPDAVVLIAFGLAALAEWLYTRAKRTGGPR